MTLLGFNYFFEPFKKAMVKQFSKDQEIQVETPLEENNNAVEVVFDKLDDKDKVGQLLAWPILIEKDKVNDDDLTQEIFLDLLNRKKPGFYTLFGDKISSMSAKLVIEQLKNSNQSVLEPWIAVDHEGGKVQRLNGDGFTKLASWNSICETDKQSVQRILGKSARELKEVGVDVVLAPMVDVGPPTGVLNTRLCSFDSNNVVENANVFINAFKEQGILSVLKHFPGIGKVNVDLHKEYAVGRVGVEDVFVYRTLLDLSPEIGVMVSHIGIDNQYVDVPCSLSADCVGELTNNFPNVLVFSDALDMKAAFYVPEASDEVKLKEPTLEDISKKAILAGNNVLIYGPTVDIKQLSNVYAMLVEEYNSGGEFKQKVDQSVKKIISYKLGVPIEVDEIKFKELN